MLLQILVQIMNGIGIDTSQLDAEGIKITK